MRAASVRFALRILSPAVSSVLAMTLRCLSTEARLNRAASQLAKGVRGNPPSRPGILPPDAFGGTNRGAVKTQISFADIAQRPIHGLAHKIPFITGFSFDYWQKPLESCVRSLLILIAEIGHQGEFRAFDEFLRAAAPAFGFLPGGSRSGIKIAAGRVHDIPGVKVASPSLHLLRRDFVCFSDKGRKDSSLVDAGAP